VQLSDADGAAIRDGSGRWDDASRSVVAVPPPVPDAVEARKLRRWLILNGHDPDGIAAAIGAMTDPVQRALTRNEWEYSTSYTRRHPMFEAFVRVTGMTADQIDAAARDVLAGAGLADYFVHRTGHGIGLSVHEEPYIVAGNDQPLAEGMAFSVEPGIYFPGRWGARIEDIVIVTADGALPVNSRPHELTVVSAPY